MQSPPVYEQIRDALTNNQTAQHFRDMIKIGTEDFHESGFAVYGFDQTVVSKLIVPEFDSLDFIDVLESKSHTSLDISELVFASDSAERESADNDELAELVYDVEHGDYSQLMLGTVRAIANIRRSSDIPRENKSSLIEEVLRKEIQMKRLDTAPLYRTDIGFCVHNHPQSPARTLSLDWLLSPSEMDMSMTYQLLKDNPYTIEGILASDGRNHGLLLYAPHSGSETRPLEYVESDEYSRQATLASLARVGFVSVHLTLSSTGRLVNGQRNNIREFVNQIG